MKVLISIFSLFFVLCVQGADYIVTFKSKLTLAEIKSLTSSVGVKSISKFDSYEGGIFSRVYRVEARSKDILDSLKGVERAEKIHSVEGEFSVVPSKSFPTNDTFSNYQWGLSNLGQTLYQDINDIRGLKIEGDRVSDLGVKSILQKAEKMMKKDIIVAVIDSGVDVTHPDLAGNIFKNEIECRPDGSIDIGAKEDKDGNGHIGDCMGINFTKEKEGTPNVIDEKGHGTHVAGIVSAIKGNAKGVSGLSNRIKVLPIKVMTNKKVGGKGLSFTDRIAKGILYAIKMKASVINLSLGWPKVIDTTYVKEAVNEAYKNGIIVVAAAGNNNTTLPVYPCSYENVLCIGATTANGDVASFSNYGGMVDILAPGDQILSTIPKKIPTKLFNVEGYDYKHGTSQAAPLVSAGIALMKGMGIDSNDEIKARLKLSSKASDSEKFSQFGAISIERAIELIPQEVVFPVFKNLSIVQYDLETMKFGFDLPFKSLWTEAKSQSVTVTIEGNEHIKLDQNHFDMPGIELGEPLVLSLSGALVDLNAKADIILKVEMKGRVFRHALTLVRKVRKDEGEVFDLGDDLRNIVSTRGTRARTILRTVGDKYKELKIPEYHVYNSRTFQLRLYQITDEGIGTAKLVKLDDVKRVLSVDKRDLNGDGVKDYLIRGQVDNKKTKQRYIMYAYLDKDLRPLYKDHWRFKFIPEVVTLAKKLIAFVPTVINGKTFSVPVFGKDGAIPKASYFDDPWNEDGEDRVSETPHIYTLVPNLKTGEMITKILDRTDTLSKWEKELGLHWKDLLEINGMYVQGIKDYKKGKAFFQMSAGEGYLRRYFNVEISKNFKMKITAMNSNDLNFEGFLRVSVTDLSGDKIRYHQDTAFAGIQNNTFVNYVMLRDNKVFSDFNYRHKRAQDHLLGVMASFRKNETSYAFFQSKGNLVAKVKGKTFASNASYTFPIHRVSFLPGSVFNELFYPVVAEHEGEKTPGFYIDAGQLHHGHIYVVKLTDKGLVAPLKNNVFVSKNCVSMNPVNYKGRQSFSLLCKQRKRSVIKYIPMD